MLCSISLSSCSCLSSIMRLLMRLKLLVSSTSHYFHRTDYRFFSALIGHSFVSGNCTFDQNSFCEWTNEVGDHFNWTLKEGPTGTKHTGPSKDHSGKQYYTQALNGGRFRPDCELAQV